MSFINGGRMKIMIKRYFKECNETNDLTVMSMAEQHAESIDNVKTSFDDIELSKKVNAFVKIEINISCYKGGQMLFSVETPHKFRDKNGKPQHCYNFIDLPVHGDLLEKIEDDIVSGAYFKNRTKRGFVLNNSEL